MNKYWLTVILLFAILSFIYSPLINYSLASEEGMENLGGVLEVSGYTVDKNPKSWEESLVLAIGLIIRTILSLLGVIFLILILYAGFLWMTAGGNEEQLTKAKNLLKNSAIGLAIVLAAYAITYFVIGWLGWSLYDTGMGLGTPWSEY